MVSMRKKTCILCSLCEIWMSSDSLSREYTRAVLLLRLLLLRRSASGIDEALEAIGEISHAENMEYSSDAHGSQPAQPHRPY